MGEAALDALLQSRLLDGLLEGAADAIVSLVDGTAATVPNPRFGSRDPMAGEYIDCPLADGTTVRTIKPACDLRQGKRASTDTRMPAASYEFVDCLLTNGMKVYTNKSSCAREGGTQI